jgi:hypothetical protein
MMGAEATEPHTMGWLVVAVVGLGFTAWMLYHGRTTEPEDDGYA